MPRPKLKTAVATIKLTPEVRAVWEAAAATERRSLANMFEVAIVAYCNQHNIVAAQPTPAGKTAGKTAKAKKAVA